MNNLEDYILDILHNYPFNSKDSKTMAKSHVASLLRNGINVVNKREREDILLKDVHKKHIYFYISYGSPGQGKWATIPWFGIFDKDITTSAQHGMYIVFLFASDGSGVYISLNIGCKKAYDKYGFKQGNIKIKKAVSNIKKLLSLKSNINNNPRVNKDPIDLKINHNSKNKLPVGYELGNIVSISCYDYGNLYQNITLLYSTRSIIYAFEDIKPFLNFNDVLPKLNKDGYNIIHNYKNKALNNNSNNIYKEKINKQTEIKRVGKKNVILQRDSFPNKAPKLSNHLSPNDRGHLAKQDYEKSEKRKIYVGNYGEEMVMLSEYNKLIKANQKELAERINHVSNKHDDYGYDIQSFDTEGNKIYIEVKSTTSSHDIPFNISSNELYVSDEKYKNNELYIIYRLYNIDIKSKKDYIPPHYIIYGDTQSIRKKLDIIPTSYSATFIQNK